MMFTLTVLPVLDRTKMCGSSCLSDKLYRFAWKNKILKKLDNARDAQ